jgi:mannosyltransferase OCH1-like enzyme
LVHNYSNMRRARNIGKPAVAAAPAPVVKIEETAKPAATEVKLAAAKAVVTAVATKVVDELPPPPLFVVTNRVRNNISNVQLRASTEPIVKTKYENTYPLPNIQVHFNTPNMVDVTCSTPINASFQIADSNGTIAALVQMHADTPFFMDRITVPWSVWMHPPVQRIPRIIHQTYISRVMPAESYRACQTWWLSNPEYEYRFYDDNLCQTMMEQWYGADHPVLRAYNMLYAGAYKSDIFRLALLQREGGVWADVSSVCEIPLSVYINSDDELVVCVDSPCQRRYANIHQAYVFVVPDHPAIAHILEYTVRTVLHRRFETPGMVFQSIAVTGPTAFAEGLNDYLGRRPLEYFDPEGPIHLFQDDDVSENPFRFTPFVTESNIRYLDHQNGRIWITPQKAVITTKFNNFSQFRTNPHYSVLGNKGYIYKAELVPWTPVSTVDNPLWQIWLQTSYVSKQMAAAMKTWHDVGSTYCFVTEAVARAATKHIMPEVWSAIDDLRPHAYKCDLLRALLLYIYGGLYVDADMVCLQSMSKLMDANDVILLSSNSQQVDNGLMYFKKPGHPLLLHYLNRAVAQIKGRIKVSSDLALTGPRLWTACVFEYFNWRSVPRRIAWNMFKDEHIAILSHEAVTSTYVRSEQVQALALDEQRMTALSTVAPGTTVVTYEDVPYVCTKYPDYNQERLVMGGTNFAAEFHVGSVFHV